MGFGGQKFFGKKDQEKKADLSALKSRFEEIKEKKVEKAVEYNIINLRMRIGCGCGGAYDDIHVAIPEGTNFPYRNGNTIQDDDIPDLERKYGVSFKKGRVTEREKSTYDPKRYRNV